MLISIVVTCYNLERYIASAIDSVRRQAHSGELEIIVVDDASTDASEKVIRSYGDVRYVCMPENSGVLLAMIKGIEAARGDLIFFLDGDDVWAQGKIAKVLDRIQSDSSIALVTHDLVYMDADGIPLDAKSIPEIKMAGIRKSAESEFIRNGILMQDDYVWLGSAFAVRKSKGRLDEFCLWAKSLPDPRNTYQDWPLAFWVAALPDANMAYVAEKLFFYRLHDANYSGDASTLAKARRNILRARNTTDAISDLARNRGLKSAIQRAADQRKSYNHYLMALYDGHRFLAFAKLLQCAPMLAKAPRKLMRESVRFVLIAGLGANKFLNLRRWLSGRQRRVSFNG